jgi:hypothetical protein
MNKLALGISEPILTGSPTEKYNPSIVQISPDLIDSGSSCGVPTNRYWIYFPPGHIDTSGSDINPQGSFIETSSWNNFPTSSYHYQPKNDILQGLQNIVRNSRNAVAPRFIFVVASHPRPSRRCITICKTNRQIPMVVKKRLVSETDSYLQILSGQESNTKPRIAFGDSYTYVQGTHGHQNYSFVGDAFDFAFDEQTLLSNKIVQNQVTITPLTESFFYLPI